MRGLAPRKPFAAPQTRINADVHNEDDVRALVDKTVARFGRLDVAVNNAGTEGQVGPITDQTAERSGTAIPRRAIEIAAAVGNQAGYGTNPVPESLNTTPHPDDLPHPDPDAPPPPVVP